MNTKIKKTETDFYKSMVALVAMFALVASQLFFIGAETVQAQDKRNNDKQQKLAAQKRNVDSAKSQFRNSAMQYERAISQVRTLSSQPLNSAQEVKRATSTYRQSRSTLDKGPYSMMVNMALNDAGFKAAVEREAKRVGHEKLIDQLKRNPDTVMRFAGARQLQSKITSDLRKQADYFITLGNKFKTAKERLEREAKSTRRSSLVPRLNNNSYIMTFASYSPSLFEAETSKRKICSPTIIPAGYNESALFAIPGAIETALISAAVIIIGAAAVAVALIITKVTEEKIEDVTEENEDTGKTDFRECTDSADADYEECLDDIDDTIPANLPFWEKKAKELAIAAAQAGCAAGYSLRMADCILLPQ